MKKWILPGIIVLFAITMIFGMGNIIGGILFLVVAAFISPRGKAFLEKKNINLKKGIKGIIIAGLLVIGIAVTPKQALQTEEIVSAESESVATTKQLKRLL